MRRTSGWVGLTVLVVGAIAEAQVPTCGNMVLEPPELCDDGNLVDGDGCDANCTSTACGNGIVTAGEACDDGNLVAGDCCSPTCLLESRPPDCSEATASVDQLWPPNHKLVPVSVVGVTDPDGDPVEVVVTAVAQDEPLDGDGDGSTCPDASGIGSDTAALRAERSGRGDGRVYHVAFAARDACSACLGEVTVCVPHDRGRGSTCGDGGALVDSTGGAPPCEGSSCGGVACVPDADELAPAECGGTRAPKAVGRRAERARALLARPGGRTAARAAKLLLRAGRSAENAGKRGEVSESCAEALARRLAGAATCAACSGE
jgi:cysteine-rich repeat protein